MVNDCFGVPQEHTRPGLPGLRVPRLVAKLGGTTTLADCLVAATHLAFRRRLVQGPSLAEYEQAFACHVGVRYAFSFSSGRVALYGLLQALGVGHGDSVLLQLPTNVVVPNAIRYAGAWPVYVDCQLDSYNMDLERAEALITSGTKVLLLQHTFGIPVDMAAALALAQRHGLIVVEDCVHALGATYDGQQVGSLGRAAFFSTEETKTITSTMGGMAVTDDPDLAARLQVFQSSCSWPSAALASRHLLRLIIYHVLAQPYLHPYARLVYSILKQTPQTALAPHTTTVEEKRGLRPPDYEQRLSNAQAALALRQLRRLEANLAHRRTVCDAYSARLREYGIPVPSVPLKAQPAYVRYPLWVENPETTTRVAAPYAQLGEWFTSVLEEAASPTLAEYEKGSCPRAELSTEHLVNLPTHPRVSKKDIEIIISAVVKASRAAEVPEQHEA